MDKNTVLAVVLCTIVLIVSFVMQGYYATKKQEAIVEAQKSAVTAVETDKSQAAQDQQTAQQGNQSDSSDLSVVYEPPEDAITTVAGENAPAFDQQKETADVQIPLEKVTVDTELFTAVLTNSGGDMVSFKWKDKKNNSDVDLILSGNKEAHAFSLAFGATDAPPVMSNFNVNRISEHIVEFYRDFSAPTASGEYGKFRLTKRYEFKPADYMFELKVTLDGGYSLQGFNFSGNAYTLSFGPQMGPPFEKLDRYYDYRQYYTFTNGKRKDAKVNALIETRPAWASISGKYFTFIAIPYLAQYTLNFSEKAEPGLVSASRLNIIRPSASVSKIEDNYRFYLGPKTHEALSVYNTGKNEFGIKDANLMDVANSGMAILSPIEKLLKWLLLIFYKITPNYGVAIIILTLFIKIVFFPLTKKGSEATLRMQALSPRIKEIQEKYKNNTQKLNTEMANLYKKEGYNPLSGCLPMLLQFPIFIAMYQLFSNHFDMRGAGFIPGWIPDLSLPEYIVKFPDGFKLPILGWTALRALPFIYVGSQLIYGKVTQMPGQQSNNQMKIMLYVMPLVFFFVLYNVPSGLLIYWIFSNLLTLVQQIIINRYIIAKKAEEPQMEPEPKIAPGKKKKKNF
ncbi:membrane protein insertase YidC [Treponema sp. R80B11-R83G3]